MKGPLRAGLYASGVLMLIALALIALAFVSEVKP